MDGQPRLDGHFGLWHTNNRSQQCYCTATPPLPQPRSSRYAARLPSSQRVWRLCEPYPSPPKQQKRERWCTQGQQSNPPQQLQRGRVAACSMPFCLKSASRAKQQTRVLCVEFEKGFALTTGKLSDRCAALGLESGGITPHHGQWAFAHLSELPHSLFSRHGTSRKEVGARRTKQKAGTTKIGARCSFSSPPKTICCTPDQQHVSDF